MFRFGPYPCSFLGYQDIEVEVYVEDEGNAEVIAAAAKQLFAPPASFEKAIDPFVRRISAYGLTYRGQGQLPHYVIEVRPIGPGE
jgi:hypothetical protein